MKKELTCADTQCIFVVNTDLFTQVNISRHIKTGLYKIGLYQYTHVDDKGLARGMKNQTEMYLDQEAFDVLLRLLNQSSDNLRNLELNPDDIGTLYSSYAALLTDKPRT